MIGFKNIAFIVLVALLSGSVWIYKTKSNYLQNKLTQLQKELAICKKNKDAVDFELDWSNKFANRYKNIDLNLSKFSTQNESKGVKNENGYFTDTF